jgi:simple sugar transport system ATP-binding protein
MLGGDPGERSPSGAIRSGGATIARLRGVGVCDASDAIRLSDVSLELHAGEILAIAAVEGAGQHELLRVIAGRLRPSVGEADLPTDVAFVPEDRHRDALILDFDAAENVALRGAGQRRGVIPWRRERERARRLIELFDVRGGAPDRRVGVLSGGNQQKLVIARELEGNPALLVAENPTRGLDIRATRAVHSVIREMAVRGGAVVVYSSDLDEVLSLATRVVALHRGKLRETTLNRDEVGRAMLGMS